jgi:cytochrome b561
MYVSLGSIALTGLAIGGLYKLGLQEEGLIMEAVISIHEFSVSATYWLVAIHILGAIFHRIKNDGVWSAMVPFSKESS